MIEGVDSDPRPYPENKKDMATFVRAMFWLSGSLTIVVGLVFVGTEMALLPPCTANCVGPSLQFGSGFTIQNINEPGWGSVFSLQPSLLVGIWTPVFFGIISVTSHFPGFHYAFVTRTWFHCAAWNVFLALFGHLGYGGNLGIIFGVFTIVVGVMCLFMQFSSAKNERPTLHMTTNGCLDRFSFMADNEIMHLFARSIGFFCGIFTVIVGLVSVLTRDFNWCPQGDYNQCFGPSLRWNNGGTGQDFVADANGPQAQNGAGGGWRTIFTFDPEFFFPLWGPIILGYLTIVQHLEGRLSWYYASWPRVCLWFLFVGLFANMAYAGSLGVICGFCSIITSFLALLIAVGGGTGTRTSFEMKINLGNN